MNAVKASSASKPQIPDFVTYDFVPFPKKWSSENI
jgi:hypothetical protein